MTLCCSSLYSQGDSIIIDEFYKKGELYKVVEDGTVQVIASLDEIRQYGHYYKVILSITNKSNNRQEFVPSDIIGEYIFCKKNGNAAKEAPSLSYDEYSRKAKRRIEMAEAFSAFGASLQSFSNQPTSSVSYSDNTGYKSRIDITDNITKDERMRQDFEDIARYSAIKERFVDSEKDHYLLRETLFPGNSVWGYTLIKYRECDKLNIHIKFSGKSYNFQWTLTEPQKNEDEYNDDIYR